MNKQIIIVFLLCNVLWVSPIAAQKTDSLKKEKKATKLFRSQDIMALRLSYSNKNMKNQADDSLFIPKTLEYQEEGAWKSIEIGLRGRGNFRLKNCYFAPLKVDIKKSDAKGTVFKGNKKLKMVLPCLIRKGNNNKVIKEYMAYKIYEALSPYHFKTRLVTLELDEVKGKKTKQHKLLGFLIEDDKTLAKRHDGKTIKGRNVHPMAQDAMCSVRNAFFQYLIGNTDYSVFASHNEKLFFINKKTLPIPYDFDMCGLVNASYAVVSQIGDKKLPLNNVRERMYRGFKRSDAIFQQIRKEYLNSKDAVFQIIEDCKPMFDDDKEFEKAKDYISSFYEVLINEKYFTSEIVMKARTK